MRGCICHSFGPSGAFRFEFFFLQRPGCDCEVWAFHFLFVYCFSFFFAIYIVHDKTNLAGKFNDYAVICDSDLNS